MVEDPLIQQIRKIAQYLGCNEGELVSEMRPLLAQARKEGILKQPKTPECPHKNKISDKLRGDTWCGKCGQTIIT